MIENKYKILVVEDDRDISSLVKVLLTSSGYQVICAYTCKDGKMLYKSHRPDLVILDIELPDSSGIVFLKELRSEEDEIPVIILSARTKEEDKVEALDLGANDYVTKPFGTNELLARVRAAIRISSHRIDKLPGGRFEANGFTIDYDSRRVYIGRNEIRLTQTEYNIIALLSEYAGRVLTYSFIIKKIWGYNDSNSTKRLQVNMVNIRKKLDTGAKGNNYIINELGVGYRMCTDEKI